MFLTHPQLAEKHYLGFFDVHSAGLTYLGDVPTLISSQATLATIPLIRVGRHVNSKLTKRPKAAV